MVKNNSIFQIRLISYCGYIVYRTLVDKTPGCCGFFQCLIIGCVFQLSELYQDTDFPLQKNNCSVCRHSTDNHLISIVWVYPEPISRRETIRAGWPPIKVDTIWSIQYTGVRRQVTPCKFLHSISKSGISSDQSKHEREIVRGERGALSSVYSVVIFSGKYIGILFIHTHWARPNSFTPLKNN